MGGYAFKEEFEPVALPNEKICLLPDKKYYRVVYVEQLPVVEKDFGAITAGNTLTDQEITELQMNKNELVQVRIEIVDDIEITVKQPKSVTRFTTKTTTFKINKYVSLTNLSEIFSFEDTPKIYFDVKNISGGDLSQSRIRFYGFKYVLEPLTEVPERATYVPVKGYAPRAEE